MKFCKDCRHRIPRDGLGTLSRFDKCWKSPKAPDSDYLVTGAGDGSDFDFCTVVRQMESECGKVGAWFDPIKQEAAPDFTISPKGERIIQGGHA